MKHAKHTTKAEGQFILFLTRRVLQSAGRPLSSGEIWIELRNKGKEITGAQRQNLTNHMRAHTDFVMTGRAGSARWSLTAIQQGVATDATPQPLSAER